jgi:phosphohistidine swiveling domain-containing protein
MKTFVLSLSNPQTDLATVGGKGKSLAKLANAGLPIPDGFHVTTEAYHQFVAANGLQSHILKALERVNATQPSTLEAACVAIGQLFAEAEIPIELANAILHAYQALPDTNPAVAVRSSATAEDLPDASFAGQQETYLNIQGAEAVLAAVQKCWASLWTGRAIAYRLRQGIPPESVALAVVVQLLVPAEASGILFTANPLTGKRNESVINAAWGLGEAIVGGLVTPDTITVDRYTGCVIQRETNGKHVMTVRTETGTEEQPVPDSLKNKPVLSDKQAAELARYGVQIEELYRMPMDIEWTLTGGKFAIVQARPITTLGEAPLEWKPPLPKGIYMRTSIVDLMPDPVSPLFATLGIPAMVAQMPTLGRYLTRSEPSLPEGYFTTINMYAYMNAHFSVRNWMWVLFGMLPSYPRMLRTLVSFWRDEAHPGYKKAVTEFLGKNILQMTSTDLWQTTIVIMDAAAYYIDALQFATMGVSAGSEGLLTKVYEKMVRRAGDPPATALLMGWDNLPAQAEKSLYDLAVFCREHELLRSYVLKAPSAQLVEALTNNWIPAGIEAGHWQELRQRLDRHLQEFGHMIFELDFAKPLPLDHPEPMLENVKMYLRGEGVNPYERQQASEERRIYTAQTAASRLKGVRRWAFSKALNWAQSLSEVREDALAEIGIGYPLMRQMLHLLGERLVKASALREAGEIFWVEKAEVDDAVTALESGTIPENLQERVDRRKAFWQKAKQTTPPPMIPFKKKYLGFNTTVWLAESEGNQAADTLKGVPASPGIVTAQACILHGPQDFDRMRPGDVLVAGTTTPAWTPLFAMASAVVTDIGGPLSHGSIVAREYSIPAVMGTGVATRRIQDGQRITVDGGAGTVTLLDTENKYVT